MEDFEIIIVDKIHLKNSDKYALISECDFEKVSKKTWLIDGNGYVYSNSDKEFIKMHQFILGINENKNIVIDHINRNKLDNTRNNLRFATKIQNAQNKSKKNGNTSKYYGVSKYYKKWRVGCFTDSFSKICDTEIEAAMTYDKYVLLNPKLGEFSKTNGLIKYEDIKNLKFETEFPSRQIKLRYDIYGNVLPKFIFFDKIKKLYIAQITHNLKTYRKKSKTISKLKQYIKTIEEQIELDKNKKQIIYSDKIITKTSDSIPCINIKSKNKNYIVLVDEDKWHELSLIKWRITGGYARGRINLIDTSMHMYLMNKYICKNDSKLVIDHINHNKIDNRLNNLRYVSVSNNNHNRKKSEKATSKYYGVCKYRNKWIVQISINKKAYKKVFDLEIDAAKHYNEKAKEVYGDNAQLNIME